MSPFWTVARRKVLATMAALCLASSLPAQNALLVEHDGKLRAVRKVSGTQAFVAVDGKLVAASGKRCALVKVDEYLPAFVAIRHMAVRTSHLSVMGSVTELNQEFHFQATFESPFRLDGVFLVLDLDTEDMGKVLFYYEVGRLEPNRPNFCNVDVPLSGRIGEGHFELHLFSGGMEVFHSEQPATYREAMLDRMIAKRIVGVQDAGPKPFVGPAPEYPAGLRKKNLKGDAAVEIRITPRGTVADAVVASATDHAFGEAALVAVRQWRFLPAVRQGQAVESIARVPFVFAP